MRTRRLAPAAGALVLGGVVVAVLATRHAGDTLGSPLHPRGSWSAAWTGGLIAAFLAYVLGLLLLRRGGPMAAVVVLAAAIQLAPLAAPLLLSRDVFLYWDYGRIAGVHHGNPYRDLPERWKDDPAFVRMGSDWYREYSPYGPVWTVAGAGIAKAAGSSAHRATLIYKIVAALGIVALVGVVAVATRSALAAALVGWNPLLAIHFAGGGHNDAWMMVLLVGGLALARRKPGSAGAPWATAAGIKPMPLLFLPLVLAQAWRSPDRRRLFTGLALGAVGLIAFSTALFGYHWLRSGIPIGNQLRESNSLGIPSLLTHLGLSMKAAERLLQLAFAVAFVLLLREAWRGRLRLARTAIALLLSVAWLVPWYGVWALGLAAVEEDAAACVVAVALSAYLLRDALPL